MLELVKVKKHYDSGQVRIPVLDGIDLSVRKGESLGVIGPSGSGKSTLLNIMGALDRQSAGDVLFEGHDMGAFSENEAAGFRNKSIGFVFQEHHLLKQCTVLENVLIPTIPLREKSRKKEAIARARSLLEKVGLKDLADRFPGSLSVGERQRVAVVRALINTPLLVLADEPTGSLDNRTADTVSDMLVRLNEELGTALVIVTHSPQLAQKLRSVYELENGVLKRLK